MSAEKTQTLTALRTQILAESMSKEGRNRFGLFSYPPAGASGSGDYDFTKAKILGEDGKVKTQPRGIYSGPTKGGKTESSYFAKGAYISIGDKYVDPDSKERQYQMEKKKKNNHDAEWKPADGSKTDPFKSIYKHMTEHSDTKKNYRGADGRVAIQPKNITTNPGKSGHGDSTVGHLLGEHYKHQADPYDRSRELAAKEREENKKKLQEAPFRSASHGGEAFNNGKKTFGKDDKVLPPAKPLPLTPKGKVHEAPFRPANPSKQGYNKTINKFPEYKSDPIRIAVRKFEDPSNKKDAFRPNNTAFNERPTPSISLNKVNLKSEMSRAF